jgi:transcriptional regulator of NAD metabolism
MKKSRVFSRNIVMKKSQKISPTHGMDSWDIPKQVYVISDKIARHPISGTISVAMEYELSHQYTEAGR